MYFDLTLNLIAYNIGLIIRFLIIMSSSAVTLGLPAGNQKYLLEERKA